MRDLIYSIQLITTANNTSIRSELTSPHLTYQIILEIIETYFPDVDLDALSIYYLRGTSWQLMIEDDQFDLEDFSYLYQDQEEIVFKVKIHCAYFLEQEQEKRLGELVTNLSGKVEIVQQLYQGLKEKFKQEALDINIFWGSPLFADDRVQRSSKPRIQMALGDRKVGLLTQQVKYSPYINAVTAALEDCDKKVQLYFKQLNKDSFNQKNVFTVVYLMAHLEMAESKKKKQQQQSNRKKYRPKNEGKKIDRRQESKQDKKNRQKMKDERQKQRKQRSMRKQKSEPPTQNKIDEDNDDAEIVMVIEQATEDQQSKTAESNTSQSTNFPLERYRSDQKSLGQEESEIIPQTFDHDDPIQVQFKKRYGQREEEQDCYLLGQELNGQLCRLSPIELGNIFAKKSRNIELLILHTSYPYHHLKLLRQHANNIILINSNPLVPQPATIYYIRQLFKHLVINGDIEAAYNAALKDLNIFKDVSSDNIQDKQFLKAANEKYVHGSLDCCCCYHLHDPKCHHSSNQSPSKYAEYHYRYHSQQCKCIVDSPAMHNCPQMRDFMQGQFKVLAADYPKDQSFYYCCCQGFEKQYYDHRYYNKNIDKSAAHNSEKDPHSLLKKYHYEKRMESSEDSILQICQGRLQGDCHPQIFQAFKDLEQKPVLGNQQLIIRLLSVFAREPSQIRTSRNNQDDMVLANLHADPRTGRKTVARHLSNLLLIKKLFFRTVLKTFHSTEDLKDIIQSSYREGHIHPFFVLVYQDRGLKVHRSPLRLHFNHFGRSINALIISDLPVQSDELSITHFQPEALKKKDCVNFVKMYRHLNVTAKKSVEKLFNLPASSQSLYPCAINEFQILNLVFKSQFFDYAFYESAIQRMNKQVLPLFFFITSIVKFTKSPAHLSDSAIKRLKQKLDEMKTNRSLFLSKLNESFPIGVVRHLRINEEDRQITDLYDELVNLNCIRNHYHLAFFTLADKLPKTLETTARLFLHYTTLISKNKQVESGQIKKKIDMLRTKSSPLYQQVYEATSINPDSYLIRYFGHDLQKPLNLEQSDQFDLENFLLFHSEPYDNKKYIYARKSTQTHSNSKARDKERRGDYSLDISREKREEGEREEIADLPHFIHLAAIMEGGLQWLRNVISTHFVYGQLSEAEKIDLLKMGTLLINNCIILLKSPQFLQLQLDKIECDLDVVECSLGNSHYAERYYHSTHNVDSSPSLISMRSQDAEAYSLPVNRTLSAQGSLLINSYPQFQGNASAQKLPDTEGEEEDKLLLKELQRLSTYKGLLYLLAEIERRAEELDCQEVFRIKMLGQFLAIQVRLEQLQLQKEENRLNYPPGDRHFTRLAQIFYNDKYNNEALERMLRVEIKLETLSRDLTELAIIKSYIIVGLSLSSSCYGRFKMVKARSMIKDIEIFLESWNDDIPFNRRESLQEGHNRNKGELSRPPFPPQFSFMRFISQNDSVYLYIVQESFSSHKFWKSSYRTSEREETHQIELYQQLLTLYHLFLLKNTKNKADYYCKLEGIAEGLREFRKQRRFFSLSTYIHNFVATFQKRITREFKQLRPHLVCSLTAQDCRNYIKLALQDRLFPVARRQENYFHLRRKLNETTLNLLIQQAGCKYLSVFSDSAAQGAKQGIVVETYDSRYDVCSKQKLVELLGQVAATAIFVCLPRKKKLAQALLERTHHQRFQRLVVYFDFTYEHFQNLGVRKNDEAQLLAFEKMIMVEAVRFIISDIIDQESKGFRPSLEQAFRKVRDGLSFLLKEKDGHRRPLLRLPNCSFRQCIFLEGSHQNLAQRQHVSVKQVELSEGDRVNPRQLEEIQKISKSVKRIQGNQNSSDRAQEFRVDSFASAAHFVEVFSFYFRDKYGYDRIIAVNFDPNNKIFLERLIAQQVLDLIFSTQRGVVIIFAQAEQVEKQQATFKECQSEMKTLIKGIDELQGKRIVIRLQGCKMNVNRKTNHILLYFLLQE